MARCCVSRPGGGEEGGVEGEREKEIKRGMKEKRKENGRRKEGTQGRVAVSHGYPFIAAKLAGG